ncbi:MAG: EamA family transporter [Microlunatus sp.]|nr:EamA family transporter [Microlunatus sp.]
MADHRGTGLAIALGSSASFALSGMFASSLIDSGWSSGAVTTLRILGAALILLVPAVRALHGDWGLLLRARWQLLGFGVFAVTFAQLGFFSAVQYIPPALALLIEFLGPVLLVCWTWARTRTAPPRLTLLGIAVAVVGLALVSGVIGSVHLDLLGVFFALFAAIGNAVYWASAASDTHGLPPVTLAGFGLGIGGVLLGVAAVVRLLPFRVSTGAAELAGRDWPMPIMIGALIVIATVVPYVLGIAGARRLGATVASFAGYSEPIFAIIWMALLLSLLPTGLQLTGAAAVVLGVVLVKIGQVLSERSGHRDPDQEPSLV